ncbi:MAG TPA: amidase, partial [Gemmataceae bacterium]
MSLTERSAAELLALQADGRVSAAEITDAFLDAIRRREPVVQAFLHVDEEDARRQAAAVDAKRQSGAPLGPLAGVPVALKDVLCTRGQVTTCGSRMLQNFRPPYDAHVVTRLREADAVLIGKTNMDEF